MTDTAQKIAEIREALEKATPGRWIYDETVGDVYSEKTDEIICCADVNDAHLIANAPEWLRFLLDELEQTRKESNMLREELHKFQELAIKAANHHKAERDKLIEALRWYAKKDTHEIKRRPDGDYAPIVLDHGQRARDILKEIGVTLE